ncbi:hypothetical protein ACFL3T_01025 [Patescibacteria group bacterium]
MNKKINIQKLIKKHKKQICGFKSKRWSIAVFMLMAVFAYFTQAYLDAKFNPEVVQANVIGNSSKAAEAFKINSTYKVHEIEDVSYYAAPGDTDVDSFAFGIDTKDTTIVLKGVNLSVVGDLPKDTIKHAKLLEGEEVIAETRVKNNEISFKFTSILQPETSKTYKVQVDISDELKSGSRFKLQIPNPYNLSIYQNDEIDYSLGAYPIEGAYVSVVGWRK